VAERLNAAALKAVRRLRRLGGSNPSPSVCDGFPPVAVAEAHIEVMTEAISVIAALFLLTCLLIFSYTLVE
jgi:hypothetical protein